MTDAYLHAHGVPAALQRAVEAALRERPEDPLAAIGRSLLLTDPPQPLDASSLDAEYADLVRFIFSNADFSGTARRYANPRANWTRFQTLIRLLGDPFRGLRVLHVAGTNGKGTTSALLDAMLRASGVDGPVGLFTSPHLHSFRERIRIDGGLVSREALVRAARLLRPAVDILGYASPFEKLTALALLCFRDAGATWAVLETGLGGRWDCTNHSTPLASGITRIGYDHMNVLGDTLTLIAGEKAGILKTGVPAFFVPQEAEAEAVLSSTAREVGAPLTPVGAYDAYDADAYALAAWLRPRHQQHNAAMATAMLASLAERGHLPRGLEGAWRAARASATWPCRFEILRPALLRTTPLVLDVAHNAPAVEALVASVGAEWPDAARVVVFGANGDKDVPAIVRLLRQLPRVLLCVAVQSTHPKAVKADSIVATARSAAAVAGEGEGDGEGDGAAPAPAWQAARSMIEALALANDALAAAVDSVPSAPSAAARSLVLCCGSVFVAADMRAALADVEPSLFAEGDWVFEQKGEPALLM